MSPLLELSGLTIDFPGRRAVTDAELTVEAGECVGLVGASGAGKTVTALSVMRLLPRGGRVTGGRISWKGRDLLAEPEAAIRSLRGREVGMVFQDALGALHPSLPVVEQVMEALTAHDPDLTATTARSRALALLESVGIHASALRASRYPHQWSGGMRQRALIAMAIANGPDLIIADEPTTALDVTTQARVLDVLREVRHRTGAALLLITHDLGVIAEMAQRVVVMHAGRMVEEGRAVDLFRRPAHAHTRELLASRPGRARRGRRAPATLPEPHSSREPALRVEEVSVTYRARGGDDVRAVRSATFQVARGETYGLVGESGSGKTTLARTLVALRTPDQGRVFVGPHELSTLSGEALRRLRSRIQIVFQDPHASLNPRRRVGDIIAQPLRVHGRRAEARTRVAELLELVELEPTEAERRPHELSGGQRQRIAIARALALSPEILVLDEPVSALDTAVQGRIIGLLRDLRSRLGLSLILIAHDLALVRGIADRVGVMRSGEIVEQGDADTVYDRPSHPYTKALLASMPRWEPGG